MTELTDREIIEQWLDERELPITSDFEHVLQSDGFAHALPFIASGIRAYRANNEGPQFDELGSLAESLEEFVDTIHERSRRSNWLEYLAKQKSVYVGCHGLQLSDRNSGAQLVELGTLDGKAHLKVNRVDGSIAGWIDLEELAKKFDKCASEGVAI